MSKHFPLISILFIAKYFEGMKYYNIQKIRPDLDLGNNIQRLRYSCNLTQDQVVAKLNLMAVSISKSTYAKIETNRMNVKVSELIALMKIFHTDMNTLFENLL